MTESDMVVDVKLRLVSKDGTGWTAEYEKDGVPHMVMGPSWENVVWKALCDLVPPPSDNS